MARFRRLLLAVSFVLFSFPSSGFASSLLELLPDFFTFEKVQINHEESRIKAWEALIASSKGDSVWQKLNKVNQFFNQVRFVEDKAQWGVEDYWASPREFLSRNAGDCEDYSIAKYFTLRAMGVAEDRLRITYVTSLPSQQAHMVLVYMEGDERTPLVLDNLQKEIEPFMLRLDLDPVYSFNNNGLWLANRESSKDEFVSSSAQQVGLWKVVSAKVGFDYSI